MTDYTCPYTGHKKMCSKLRDKCPKWLFFSGTDPNTGQKVNTYDCADRWQVRMMMEIAQETRLGAAETNKFRNIMFRLASGENPQAILASENLKLTENVR